MEAQVIGNAEMLLRLAIPKRERLQEQFEAYGPNATIIPSN
jgi:hypothetical protein